MANLLQEEFQKLGVQAEKLGKGLRAAAAKGELGAIQVLLQAGADVGSADCEGDTALHFAARQGQAAALQALLAARRAAADVRNERGVTPLMQAAAKGHAAAMEALLAKGAQAGARDQDGVTPLHYAAHDNQVTAIEALVAAGAPLQAGDREGRTPLDYARAKHSEAAVAALQAAIAEQAARSSGSNKASKGGSGSSSSRSSGGSVEELRQAAARGDAAAIRREVQAGASVNAQDSEGNGPLHWACYKGRLEAVNALLDLGALPSLRNNADSTPLHLAALAGECACIRALLQAGVNTSISRERDGASSLHLAARSGRSDAIQALLDAGASVAAVDNDGDTPLHEAVRCFAKESAGQYMGAVRTLLDAHASPAAANKHGVTPMAVAISKGFPALVQALRQAGGSAPSALELERLATRAAASGDVPSLRRLLHAGVSPNAADSDGDGLLHWAAMKDKAQAVQLLLDEGAKLDATNNDGRTALHWTASSGNEASVRVLLGAEPPPRVNLADNQGRTPLILAARKGHTPVVAALCEAGASLAIGDDSGRTALHNAASQGQVDVVRELLKRDCPLNQRDHKGNTALHWACAKGHVKVVEELLSAGALVNTADKDGDTGLHLLAYGGGSLGEEAQLEIARLLLDKGADATAINAKGKAPAAVAGSKGFLQLQRLLQEAAEGRGKAPAPAGPAEPAMAAESAGEQLLAAAEQGDVAAIRRVVGAGADVNACDAEGRGALHCAAAGGHVAAIAELAALGADMNLQDGQGNTALHEAARRGQVAGILELLGRGANLELKNAQGATPLHVASREGKTLALAALVNGGAEVNASGEGGTTPLMEASAGGHLPAVRALLVSKANPAQLDADLNNALHYLASRQRPAAAVPSSGVEQPAQQQQQQQQQQLVVSQAHAKVAAELMLAGADPQAINSRRETAEEIAARVGQQDPIRSKMPGNAYVESIRSSRLAVGGIPDFWATALRHHPFLAPKITDVDAQILQYLTRVQYDFTGMTHRTIFVFRTNPFFEDERLVKEYPTTEDASQIKGTKIRWYSGKDPTLPPASSASRPARTLQPGESFFNWFKALEVSSGAALSEGELKAVEEDCLINEIIGSVLPRAQEWYRGTARWVPPADESTDTGDDSQSQDDSSSEEGAVVEPMAVVDIKSIPIITRAELVTGICPAAGSLLAQEALDAGRTAMEEGDYEWAYRKFAEAREFGGGGVALSFEAALGCSVAALAQGNRKQAVADAKEAQRLDAGDPRGAVAEGVAQMDSKNPSQAYECFKRAAQLDPYYPDIQVLLGTAKSARRLKNRLGLGQGNKRQVLGPVVSMALRLLAGGLA